MLYFSQKVADGIQLIYLGSSKPEDGLKFHFSPKFEFGEVWRAAHGVWGKSSKEELARMEAGLPAIAPDGDRDLRVDAMRLVEIEQQLKKMHNSKKTSE